jgi:hypothetical protein
VPGRKNAAAHRQSVPLLNLDASALVAIRNSRIGAEKGVLGHIRRIVAAWDGASDRLGDGADMMGHRATAKADVTHVEIDAFAGKFSAFVTIAREGIERSRKWTASRNSLDQV